MGNVNDLEISTLDAATLRDLYAKKILSPVEVTKAFLSRIEQLNPAVNAYCYISEESAILSAKASEERWFRGEPLSPIDGAPTSIKDLTMVAGMPTRSGSQTSSNALSVSNAPFTDRMLECGAVILGKTTTPEFGWKGVTDNLLTGITRNPWDTHLTAGGSSGGAAAAAALNMGILHQASDAGGSIRIPASFCGVFGIKPTFGYVPQWPASAMTTLSHLGPITRTVEDSILMLNAVSKCDDRDWYSNRTFHNSLKIDHEFSLKGLKVAYSPTLGFVKVDPEVKRQVDEAVTLLIELGADVVEVDPGFNDPVEIFSTLWFSGAAKVVKGMSPANQALLDKGFLEIGLQGANIDIVDYMKAVDARAELGVLMNQFHQEYDLLITPTLPITAFEAGRNTQNDAQKHWMDWTPFTYPFNLTQQPAASVPFGFANGLPVGVQIVAARGNDQMIFQVANRLMQANPPETLFEPRIRD